MPHSPPITNLNRLRTLPVPASIMTRAQQPVLPPAPRIQLMSMPQLAHAIRREDDWTGTKDAAARRRAQTRLNTRAYRKRKALAKKKAAEASSTATVGALVKSEPLVECWDVDEQSVRLVPASHAKQLYNARNPLLPNRANKARRQQQQQKFQIIFPLCPDHLITLLQFNALRALAVNRTLISGILATPLDCDGEEVIHVVPYPTNPKRLPPALLPTVLQQTVPHGDWIDLFPCPEARDRLIRATGSFDEDELWADCSGGVYEGFPDDEMERRGVIAWSPPWDITGWELSEGFLRKWGWVVKGLAEPLEATNRWRIDRGEEPFVYRDDCTSHPRINPLEIRLRYFHLFMYLLLFPLYRIISLRVHFETGDVTFWAEEGRLSIVPLNPGHVESNFAKKV